MLNLEQDRVLRRVLRLVDLSGDLDRNRSDGDLVDAGGTIYRVVDENIFELFIRPSRHREAVETFYADIWSSSSKVDEEWRSFEAQAGLITAEFILSGLSQPSGQKILMSDHHRWELAHRVEALTSEIRSEVARRSKAVKRDLRTKLAVSYDLEQGKVTRSREYVEQGKFRALAADLADLAEAPQPVKDRFEMARVAAAFFANDPLTEALDQLGRTVSKEVRSRLSSLELLFRPSSKEAVSIETDAERWFERLAAELRQPGHQSRLRAQRDIALAAKFNTRGSRDGREEVAKALRNDARTMAFVQWVARTRLDPKSRIVFITGDPVLFDAYRRWHVETAESAKTPLPFTLRRATQYSPIFNPNDSGGDLAVAASGDAGKSLLFTLVQQAVEAALLPLPFAVEMQTRVLADPSVNLTRERLALKLVDCETPSADEELAGLADLMNAEWVKARASEIEGIRESWQKAQRFAIGASSELIVPRLGKELKAAAAEYFARTAKDAAPILNRYVTNVLDKLVDDSILLWLPLAEGFGEAATNPEQRAALTKRFSVALATQAQGTEASDPAGRSPKAVFARAACRALEVQDIANANRFATLARRADRVDAIRGDTDYRADPDLLYLQCVTLRYSISTVDLHLKRSSDPARRKSMLRKGVDQVKTYYGQAANLIDKCLAIHDLDADEPQDTAAHWAAQVGYLRALSERAAVNLFMATSLGLAARNGPSPLLDDFHQHLDLAHGDLWRCVKVDQFDKDGDPILQLIRNQYIPNLAAFDVLAYLLSSDTPYKFQTWPRKARNQIRAIWKHGVNLHALLNAELRAYAILTDDEAMKGGRTLRRGMARDQQELHLPLDRELLRAIYQEILHVGSRRA